MDVVLMLVVYIAIIALLLYLLMRVSARIAGRFMDFGEEKDTTVSPTLWVFIIAGLFMIIRYGHILLWYGWIICILLVVLPVLWQLRKVQWNPLDAAKIMLVRLVAWPFLFAAVLLGAMFVHEKSTTTTDWFGNTTEHRLIVPGVVDTDGWQLRFVYDVGGLAFYENQDGARCLVGHKRTSSWSNVDYDVIKLYDTSKRLPLWISWLY